MQAEWKRQPDKVMGTEKDLYPNQKLLRFLQNYTNTFLLKLSHQTPIRNIVFCLVLFLKTSIGN